MRRRIRPGWIAVMLMFAASVQAQEYADTWGPSLGSVHAIAATDQLGAQRSLNDLSGEKGLLLFLNRSADW